MLRTITLFLVSCIFIQTWASPVVDLGSQILSPRSLQRRTDPYFPDEPESCPICAKDYDSIRSCAEATPVFQNFSMVMFNPGAFVDVIQCACADTFKAVFPQCVDCFLRTGQERVIMGEDLPSVVEGIRRICAVASTLVGNVTDSNNAPPPPVAEGTGTRTVQAVSFTSVLLVAGLSVAAMLAGS